MPAAVVVSPGGESLAMFVIENGQPSETENVARSFFSLFRVLEAARSYKEASPIILLSFSPAP